MAKKITQRKVVLVSFLVNLLDVITNLVVALVTGSAVVFGQMAQGLGDGVGSALLVLGARRAARPPDARHPLGYAREAFFWSILSAVSMLIFGAGLSAWRGVQQLMDPKPLDTPLLAVAVLVLAVFTNGYAVGLSARKLGVGRAGLRKVLQRVDQPLVKGAFIRDVIGTFTSILGLVALLLYNMFGLLVLDALGALSAAVCMAVGSIVLMAQARALITGRSLSEEKLRDLRAAILADPMVEAVNNLVAIHSGAFEILVDTDLDLREDLNTTQIEAVLDSIEARVRVIMPEVTRVRVLLNSP
ncbi:cation diffusion facilitator family transporter [Marimonas arenosa]|uniref:Cation diffusion facilitator family transporter n=1 Tax=Marimonas arenosa TaxID=1795305 RepID=A0AAE3WDR7_9RHOB|nr:cation diffusion facilitator family transporter [Marimonas arenosa]MDQ2090653.1 cation diffusion facilitator family transporter [Marimonas arenosa]